MTSGSSNIDPTEFNELRENGNGSDDQARVAVRSSQMQTMRDLSASRRRRRRRHRGPVTLGSSTPYRIRIYQTVHEPLPGRQALNRIIFAIARALRLRRTVPAQAGQRPGVIYHRNYDSIDLEVVIE
ncbi:hypothetical protein KR222_006246 [Zaprionus bogoriensis]|nr:hypothetical protein KR222_006246 [Zaprionus bogoriensis]